MKLMILCAAMLTALFAHSETALYVVGSPDSYIDTQGTPHLIHPSDGYQFKFNDIWTEPRSVLTGLIEMDVESAGSTYWSITLKTPGSSVPALGHYDGVPRWTGFPSQLGLDLVGTGRRYNISSGWFDILELSQTDGYITKLAVDAYEKSMDNSGLNKWTFMSYRFNSSIAVVPEPSFTQFSFLGFMFMATFYTMSRK